MKNDRKFLTVNFPFLTVNFSVYLNRCVFVMISKDYSKLELPWRNKKNIFLDMLLIYSHE